MRNVILLFAVFVIATYAHAQMEEAPVEECKAHPALQAFIDVLAFSEACATFNSCAENNSALACTPHFLAARLSRCDPANTICRVQAELHSALIGLTYTPDAQTIDPTLLTTLSHRIANTFMLREASLDEASAWYLPLIKVYRQHPMLDYSLAVLNAFKENPDAAAALYDTALSQNFNDPLIYWSWGNFLAQLDESEQELSDAELPMFINMIEMDGLPQYMQDALTGSIDENASHLSPPVAYVEYPVFKRTDITVGLVANDLSLFEGKRVALQNVGEEITLLIRTDIDSPRDWYDIQPDYISLRTTEDESLLISAHAFYAGVKLDVALWPRVDGGYNGQRTFTLPDAEIYEEFILMPRTSGDPRTAIFRCPDAPLPLLSAGMKATPALYESPFQLHFAAGESTPVEIHSAAVTIVEGPVCARGGTWYRIIGNGFAGWIRENADSQTYAVVAR